MEWIRARTREQKEHRIRAITDAAAQLFEQHDFEDITLAAIAREADFTRSNLYKYFKSKEEIFLALIGQDLLDWRRDLSEAFENGRAYSAEEFARTWAEVVTERSRLLRLVSILPAFLEKNASFDRLLEFKKLAKVEMEKLAALLVELFPGLAPDKALQFLNLQIAAAIGLHQLSNMTDMQRKIMDRPEFSHFQVDFAPYFEKAAASFMAYLSDDIPAGGERKPK